MHNSTVFVILTTLVIYARCQSTDNEVEDIRPGDGDNGHAINVNYFVLDNPERISLFMTDVLTVSVNYSLPCEDRDDVFTVKVTSKDRGSFVINGNTTFMISCSRDIYRTTLPKIFVENGSRIGSGPEHTHGSIEFKIDGKILGIGDLNLTASKNNATDDVIYRKFPVFVLRKLRVVDLVFRYVVGAFFFVVFIAFGCKLELDVVKECIKKPIAPGIGLTCQYLVMPLLGYGIAVLVPIDDKSVRLGIFLCAVCPGGGASNIYTYLLGGDISLSITMTFISTLASIGFMPLWIYTLGRTLMDEEISLTIPFIPLLQTIALTTIPVLIGVFIKYKFVKAATLLIKILKPVTIIFIILFIVIGLISNMYLFKMFKPTYILAGSLLPYLGYLIGGVVAAILRQPWTRIKTIAIEAGMQNVGVAFILLLISFPPPLGDIATLAPAATGMMTPLPGFLIAIPYLIYRKCTKKYDPVKPEDIDQHVNGKPNTNEEIVEIEKLSSV